MKVENFRTCFVASSFLKLVPVLEWELPWTDDRRYPTYNPRTMRLLSSCPSCSTMHSALWLNAKWISKTHKLMHDVQSTIFSSVRVVRVVQLVRVVRLVGLVQLVQVVQVAKVVQVVQVV